MSVQMVLLPVFVLVGLTFVLLLWMAGARRQALVGGQTKIRDIALRQPNWPERATQIGNCFSNQFEIPVLFYVLIDQIGPVLTTLIVATSPIFAIVGGMVFLRERVGARLALGVAVTLAGVFLATLAHVP